jgi:mevalonate kinase
MSQSFVVSAPGKVILSGEHAVVYGKSAIACSLGLFTTSSVGSSDSLTLILDNFDFTHTWELKDFNDFKQDTNSSSVDYDKWKQVKDMFKFENAMLSDSVCTFLYLWLSIRNNHKGISLTVQSKLPIGGGLGSSASYCVVLAASLLCFYGYLENPVQLNEKDLDLINSWAFIGETLLHGNPSGIDNMLITYGGAKLFTKGDVKNILGFSSMKFLLIDSKVEKNTGKQVALVRERVEKVIFRNLF